MDTKYTVYKTTNLINGRTYIGMHKTKNPNDSYLGSGFQLRQAIQKYGKANFKKEVLAVFDTDKEARDLERELVNGEWISNPENYNLAPGGGGHGGRQSKEARMAISERNRILKKGNQYRKGIPHSQAAKDAVSKANSGRKQNISDEERERRRQRCIERNKSEKMRVISSSANKGNKHRLGHKNSVEHNEAISRAQIARPRPSNGSANL